MTRLIWIDKVADILELKDALNIINKCKDIEFGKYACEESIWADVTDKEGERIKLYIDGDSISDPLCLKSKASKANKIKHIIRTLIYEKEKV